MLGGVEKETGVEIQKIVVDDNGGGTVISYTIRSIPTIVIVKDGKEVDRISGLIPSEVLEAKFKLHNKKANE